MGSSSTRYSLRNAGLSKRPPRWVVAPQRGSDLPGIQLEFARQEIEEKLHEADQGDAVGATHLPVEPVTPAIEGVERRGAAAPEQRRRFDEIAAVADEVPVTREPPQLPAIAAKSISRSAGSRKAAADCKPSAFISWRLIGVPRKPLENADLDLVRAKRHQPIEPGGKTVQGFTRQTGDEVRVQNARRFRGAGIGSYPQADGNPGGVGCVRRLPR